MSSGEYRRVSCTRLWAEGRMRGLRRGSEDAHTLLIYLLTCPASSFIGIYALPLAYAEGDLCWSERRLKKALKALQDGSFVAHDPDAGVIYVPLVLEFHPLSTKDQADGAVRRLKGLPQTPLLDLFKTDLLASLGTATTAEMERLRPLLAYLGVVDREGVRPPVTPPVRRPPHEQEHEHKQEHEQEQEQQQTDNAASLSLPSRNGKSNGQVPQTRAEEVFDRRIYPLTRELHMRDRWLVALRQPDAVEAAEEACRLLQAAMEKEEIRSPGAFLWHLFQSLVGT